VKKVEKDWVVHNSVPMAVTTATFLIYRPDTWCLEYRSNKKPHFTEWFTKIAPLWLQKPIHPLAQKKKKGTTDSLRHKQFQLKQLNIKSQHFWQEPNFSLRDRKRSETKVEGEYCWAITRGGAVKLRPIRFPCAGVWTKQDCLAYRNNIVDNIYTRLWLAPRLLGT